MDTIATAPVRLLTPKQVAELTGFRVGTLAKLRLTGRGPEYRKCLSAIRYEESAVRDWINALPRRRSTSDTAP